MAKKKEPGWTRFFDGVEKTHKTVKRLSKLPLTSKSTKDGYYPKKRTSRKKSTAKPNYRRNTIRSVFPW